MFLCPSRSTQVADSLARLPSFFLCLQQSHTPSSLHEHQSERSRKKACRLFNPRVSAWHVYQALSYKKPTGHVIQVIRGEGLHSLGLHHFSQCTRPYASGVLWYCMSVDIRTDSRVRDSLLVTTKLCITFVSGFVTATYKNPVQQRLRNGKPEKKIHGSNVA